MANDERSIAEYEEFFAGGPNPQADEITRDTEWRTKDGQRVRIRNMSDSHLLNTIRVLRGLSPIGTTFKTDDVRRRDWLNAMANEAYARGLAIDAVQENEKHAHE